MSNKSVVSRLLWGGVFLLCFGTAALAADVSKLVSQARAQVNSQSYDAAEGTLKRVLSRQKNNLEARFLLARISELREDYREAIKRYKYLLFLKPKQIPAMAGIARSAEKLGDAKQARQTYLNISMQEPDQMKWLFEAMRIEMEKTSVKYSDATERRLKKLIQAKYREPEPLKYLIDYYHSVGAGYKAKKYEKMLTDAGTPATPQHKKAASTETAHRSQPKTEPGFFGGLIKKISKNITPATTNKNTAGKKKKSPYFSWNSRNIWKITAENIEQVKAKAEAGDPYYQAILGEAYNKGTEVKKDYKEALKWFKLSAEQKHPIGLYLLASMYDYGLEVKKDKEKAGALYKEAFPGMKKLARKGNPRAQTDLGAMYEHARGMSVDDAEAAKWYRKAADQGYATAQDWLGGMYEHGYGVPKDYAEAVKWYRKAADQGNAGAQFDLGAMYGHGRGMPENDAEAVKWYRKAADQGYAMAQSYLGTAYRYGGGVPKDYAEAAKWYRKAADQGDAPDQYWLGEMYENGRGVPKDYAEAAKWYKKAAEQGHSKAKERLAKIEARLKKEAKQAREAKLDKSYAALKAGFGQQAVKLFREEVRNYGPLDYEMFRSSTAIDLIEQSGKPPLAALGQFALIAIAHADKTQTRLPVMFSNKKSPVVRSIARSARFEGEPLEVGDVLTSMDGIEPGEGRWTAHLAKLSPRTPVKIIFERNGARHSTSVLTRAGYRGSQAGIVYFKLFEYGIFAYHAGHPEITLTAVRQLQTMIDEGYVVPRYAKPFVAVLEALVMAQAKGSDAALAHILDAGGLIIKKDDGSTLDIAAIFFEGYATALWPLYKDHGKVAFLLDKAEDKIKWPKMKAIPPQPFPDLSGRLIQPAAPPKLMASPKAKKKTNAPARKPAQESGEPEVEILD